MIHEASRNRWPDLRCESRKVKLRLATSIKESSLCHIVMQIPDLRFTFARKSFPGQRRGIFSWANRKSRFAVIAKVCFLPKRHQHFTTSDSAFFVFHSLPDVAGNVSIVSQKKCPTTVWREKNDFLEWTREEDIN